ncbi:Uncharacterised protein [Mycobacteroides abscessus subsp. massiliense]|nr:Uncharacterised protein [Mycobacteroides abscessus subsp. massiliense]
MVGHPGPETLWHQGFPAEHHHPEPELLMFGQQRIDGLQGVEGRRRLTQHTDAFANQQGVKVFRRARDCLGNHHQQPAMEQRTENLPHREVEGQRMALRPYLSRRQFKVGIDRF